MSKMYIALLSIFLVSGCSQYNNDINYGNIPFIDMEQDTLMIPEHIDLCKRMKSHFCSNSPSYGDIKPTREYVMYVLKEMNSNYKYVTNSTWKYNNNIYEYLEGDCEDIASTMATHMINDGISKEYISLAYRMIGDGVAHVFLAVETIDSGILHLDYGNSGYPIEPRINFHMKMDNVGVYKWVKGNIK